jgi:hypothetical protein
MSIKRTTSRAIADAAREAAAKENRRACEIVNLCVKHGQPLQHATKLIVSGKTTEECEAELKQVAQSASWGNAISKAQAGRL